MRREFLILAALGPIIVAPRAALAQETGAGTRSTDRPPRYVPEDHRPALFFREDWKHVPPNTAEHPVIQESVTSPNLELKLYGETKQGINPDTGIWEIQRASPKDDPTFIYTGPCMTPCALALRNRNNYVDLTGLAKMRWRT